MAKGSCEPLASCPSSSSGTSLPQKVYIIPAYVFVPDKVDESGARKAPVVTDFHVGGFVLGFCLEQTPFCAKLARELNRVLVTVDSRMGPASKNPAALEDTQDVLSPVLVAKATDSLAVRKAVAKNIEGDRYPRISGPRLTTS